MSILWLTCFQKLKSNTSSKHLLIINFALINLKEILKQEHGTGEYQSAFFNNHSHI